MREKKTVSVPLSKELCERLDALAAESCRTRAGYLRRLIKAYLQRIEQDPAQKI